MKNSTLERSIGVKQDGTDRRIVGILLKLLAVTATFGATCASVMVPHFVLLDAGFTGPLYWLLLVLSVVSALMLVIFIGLRIDGKYGTRRLNKSIE